MRAADADMPTLPEDPAALRALLLEALDKVDLLASRCDSVTAERDALVEQNERLRHLLLKLQRRQFGRKSERLTDEQLQFAFEEIEATLAENAAEAGKRSPAAREQQKQRRRTGRGRLPAHLPEIEQVLTPEATACPCCQGPLVEIGVDTARRLDVIPAQFRVLVTKRPKLACRACPGVVLQAPAPARLIEGGMPTEATVAHVLVARYADHLPLYRQAQILARQGIEISRAVLADWLGTATREIAPVMQRLHEILQASPRLFADETTMPVLDPGRGQTKKGYAWAIARDDRPWGGTDPPAVVFHYAPGRGAEHLKALLTDYQGHPAMRRLCRLQDAGRGRGRHHAGVLLEPCAQGVHRAGQGQDRPDRHRDPAADRRALRHRGRDPRQAAGGPPRRPPGEEQAAGRGAVRLARGTARAPAGRQPDRQGDPLSAEPPRGALPVPRGWQDRARHEHGRTRHPAPVDDPLIIPLLFKYLETLEVGFADCCDAGHIVPQGPQRCVGHAGLRP